MNLEQLEKMGFTFEYGSEGAIYNEHSNEWCVDLEYVEICKDDKSEIAQWNCSITPQVELCNGTFDKMDEDVLKALIDVCKVILEENGKRIINTALIEHIKDGEDYEEIRDRAEKLGEYFKDKDEDWLLVFARNARNCHTDFIIALQAHYGQTNKTANEIYSILHS
jgi:hypothetical protein